MNIVHNMIHQTLRYKSFNERIVKNHVSVMLIIVTLVGHRSYSMTWCESLCSKPVLKIEPCITNLASSFVHWFVYVSISFGSCSYCGNQYIQNIVFQLGPWSPMLIHHFCHICLFFQTFFLWFNFCNHLH